MKRGKGCDGEKAQPCRLAKSAFPIAGRLPDRDFEKNRDNSQRSTQ